MAMPFAGLASFCSRPVARCGSGRSCARPPIQRVGSHQPGHTLVTAGLYGVIRHPSWLGLLVNSLGWALAFRLGVGELLTALLIPLVARIRAEERLLHSQFGGEYEV
jgi:protein-S-isoprenylcysteine O-methyltransferase Ste14